MKPWESIVVGIDFSDSSRAPLREAVRLAHWHHCRLHVTHVIPIEKHYEPQPNSSLAISIVRDQVKERLKELSLAEIAILDQIEYHILVGQPYRELCQLTQDIEADLLVLGSSRENGRPHRAGSIGVNCIRKSPAPVLLVRPTHEAPYHAILVGIDFSETSLKALQLAAEIAFENQSHLHLVHVHEPTLSLSDYSPSSPGVNESRAHEHKQHELLQKLNACKKDILQKFPDLPVTTHLLNNRRASDAIISFIEDHQISLTVLGTRSRTSLHDLPIGATAERLIYECPSSVLAVKPNDFPSAL